MTTRARPEIEAVVPLYNEQAIVAELVRRLAAAMGSLTDAWSILLVDDGSRDQTWTEIQRAAEGEPRVRGRRFSRNFGQHVAITAGLDAADAEWVVVMDGDLQDLPETIPALYAKANEGFDVVLVERLDRPVSLPYKLAQRTFYGLLKFLAQTEYNPAFGNFSIVHRRVVAAFRQLPESSRFYGGLLFWLGFHRTSIRAPHGERFAGPPSYTLRKRVHLANEIILAYSVRPLHAAILLGGVSTVVSFGYGVYIVVGALVGGFAVQGWASVIASIYFVGGVLMVLLGMNSIYLGRVYAELKGRPLYVLADEIDRRPADAS